MSMHFPPRSVFGQLTLVIGLVLFGAAVLTGVMARLFATQPAAEQLLHAMNSFANVSEELAKTQPTERTKQMLQRMGLEVRTSSPPISTPRLAPLLSELRQLAPKRLPPGRELRLGGRADGNALWLKLATEQPIWVSFALDPGRKGIRAFSLAMLLGCVLLVWLAAAYYAGRIVLPLKHLAKAAPDIVRGQTPALHPVSGPQELVELTKALNDASNETRTVAEERAFMLAGISHDLRTPLTRLQFALELLSDVDLDLRAGMSRDINEIDAILAQFIAYARDGRDEATESVDLAVICRNAVSASSHDWNMELPAYAPLQGKPMALLRAVENLVVNAQRHGAPNFSLRLLREADAWRLVICDQGPGLTLQQRERVRRPFVHGGNGSGLGLAIVERIAHQHHGELTLESNHGRGLCASLILRNA